MAQNNAAPDATTNGHHPTLADRLRRGALPLPPPRPLSPALLEHAEERASDAQNRVADKITRSQARCRSSTSTSSGSAAGSGSASRTTPSGC